MPKKVFQTMNGLRGVAALMVLMFHAPEWFGVLTPSKGFLAVDLFFVLSGFVIAFSYEDKFGSGMTIKRFVVVRLIRLYPLYIIGTIPAVLILLFSLFFKGTVTDINLNGWRSIPFAVAMFPTPNIENPSAGLYPLNGPAWSLFFEIIINSIYASTWRWWSVRNLLIVMSISGALLLSRQDFYGEGGWNWGSAHLGLLRVSYSFSAGLLIFRLFNANQIRAPQLNSIVILTALPTLLMLPSEWVVQFCVLVGFPLLVVVAVKSDPVALFRPLFGALGGASYAIYAIHLPLMNLTNATLTKIGFAGSPHVVGAVFLAAIVPASLLIDKLFDMPVRQRLSRMLFRELPRNAVQSST